MGNLLAFPQELPHVKNPELCVYAALYSLPFGTVSAGRICRFLPAGHSVTDGMRVACESLINIGSLLFCHK